MPIRADQRHLYPPDWPEISRRIRFERAKGRCETCGAPHGQVIYRNAGEPSYVCEDGSTYHAESGEFLGMTRGSELLAGHFVRVVLTTAHLNHDPTDCSDGNLMALCQLHHLRHDAALHAENARQTRRARLAVGDLFDPAVRRVMRRMEEG
jgi:hypothetical protein